MRTKPVFREDGVLLNKDDLIDEEVARLQEEIFPIISKHMRTAAAEELINTAANTSACCVELRKLVNLHGYVETYQNGENQTGQKESTYSRQLTTYEKMNMSCREKIAAIVSKERALQAKMEGKKASSDGFDDFVVGRLD